MKLPFLRTPQRQDDPTVVAMTGVQLGDKVHFWGDTASLLLPLAARTGLSGQVTVVSPDAATLVATAEREGLLVDQNPAPSPDAAYDLAVVQAEGDWRSAMSLVLPPTRAGGRVIAIAGEPPKGLLAKLGRPRAASGPSVDELAEALTAAGWRRVREIGERDGMRFVEGVRG
jgi:hypothetical protein